MKTKPQIVITLSIAALATSACQSTNQKPVGLESDYQSIQPEKHERANIITKLKHQRLKEGNNLIVTNTDGVRLYATVKEGKITGWKATSPEGKELTARWVMYPNPKRAPRCYVCYYFGGRWTCYRTC